MRSNATENENISYYLFNKQIRKMTIPLEEIVQTPYTLHITPVS